MQKARLAAGNLLSSKGSFSNGQFARLMEISRQRASVLLKRLVDTEELKLFGYGRGAKYERGPGWGLGPWGCSRGTQQDSVWAQLAERCPHFAYIALAVNGRTEFRTRKEARELLNSKWSTMLCVIDFRGVKRVTPAFAQEFLAVGYSYANWQAEPINMSPEVESVVRFVRARDDRSSRPVPQTRRTA
jgi:hypothetical protein